MSESNTTVKITSDGHVVTYDSKGSRIDDLCGDLKMIHKILRINRLPGIRKSKLPFELRVRNAEFCFKREDTGEEIPIPIEHVVKFSKHITADDLDIFIEEMMTLNKKQ